MNGKVIHSAMMPAPRPRPINGGVTSEELTAATRDLGFGRASSDLAGVEPEPAPVTVPPIQAAPVASALKAKPATKSKIVAPVAPVPSALLAPLKFDIDRDLSNFLKMEAVRRGATVKFLILEALAGKGYPVDMANTPEDGRRHVSRRVTS